MTMVNIQQELAEFKASKARYMLERKYQEVLLSFIGGGTYIWGTGELGRYAFEQCRLNDITIKGYIDNNKEKQDISKKIFSYEILTADDIVIIASISYPEIAEQLTSLGIKKYFPTCACRESILSTEPSTSSTPLQVSIELSQ